MAETLVNRVANSGIITLNLEDHFPTRELVHFDLKDFLYMELIIKEKDYRQALKAHDWSQYADKIVAVHCSTDAIIPMWAYMLVSVHLTSVAAEVYQGTIGDYLTSHYDTVLDKLELDEHKDKMVVIKGCGDKAVPPGAYMKLTTLLLPVAKSIMYGEPCSTVPIYKRPKTT